MTEEMEVLKQYVESLGLDTESGISLTHMSTLRNTLSDAGEFGLADWVGRMNSPGELEDFIVNTLYG